MLWNHSTIDSINQYYHGNVGRALLPPWPVEGKGNYAGSELAPERERETEKEHLNNNKRIERRRACLFLTPLNVLLFALYACLIIGIL